MEVVCSYLTRLMPLNKVSSLTLDDLGEDSLKILINVGESTAVQTYAAYALLALVSSTVPVVKKDSALFTYLQMILQGTSKFTPINSMEESFLANGYEENMSEAKLSAVERQVLTLYKEIHWSKALEATAAAESKERVHHIVMYSVTQLRRKYNNLYLSKLPNNSNFVSVIEGLISEFKERERLSNSLEEKRSSVIFEIFSTDIVNQQTEDEFVHSVLLVVKLFLGKAPTLKETCSAFLELFSCEKLSIEEIDTKSISKTSLELVSRLVCIYVWNNCQSSNQAGFPKDVHLSDWSREELVRVSNGLFPKPDSVERSSRPILLCRGFQLRNKQSKRKQDCEETHGNSVDAGVDGQAGEQSISISGAASLAQQGGFPLASHQRQPGNMRGRGRGKKFQRKQSRAEQNRFHW